MKIKSQPKSRSYIRAQPGVTFILKHSSNSRPASPSSESSEASESSGLIIEIIKNTAPKLSKLSKHLQDEVKIPSPSGGLSCQVCGTRKTGQWRRGPNGPRTLCNGCGLSWAKSVRGRK